VLEKLGASRR